MANGKSFFERLTGAVRLEEDNEDPVKTPAKAPSSRANVFDEEADEEAELTVDVYQTPSEIIIKAMVPGVKGDDLDVLTTRSSVTIRGKRLEDRTISDGDYFHRELYWGSFSRTIELPEEVDVDNAEAVEKHGMLILHLPKMDRNRQARLKVKGN